MRPAGRRWTPKRQFNYSVITSSPKVLCGLGVRSMDECGHEYIELTEVEYDAKGASA